MLNRKNIIFLSAIIVISILFIVCGSFFDWQISNAISKPLINTFSKGKYYSFEPISMIVEIFGPMLSILVCGTCLLILFSQNDHAAPSKHKSMLRSLFIWFTISLYTVTFRLFFFNTIWQYIINPSDLDSQAFQPNAWVELILYFISFAAAIGAVVLSIKLLDKYSDIFITKKHEAIQILIISIVIVLLLVILKMTVQRLRFRALLFLDDSLDNPADYFSNWFNANNKLPFLPNDMVQSFPSGHVLIATNLISIWLFIKKTYKKNNLILWTKIAIIAVLALNVIGRIISGAHYMSDVGWSLLLGTIVTVSVMYIYSLRINRMQVKTHKSHKLLD